MALDKPRHDQHDRPEDACAAAHGSGPPRSLSATGGRALIAVFASPVAGFLLRYGADLGFRCVLVEPDPARAAGAAITGAEVVGAVPDEEDADIVVTDHHREELGLVLRDALAVRSRWIGVMGNPRHPGPHISLLTEMGVADADIKRVHRPIGLNVGSGTPPEIAIATIAGLLADRNGRPGGFEFTPH